MAAVLSSSSPSFWPLSSSAIRARARSPTTPEAAPFMPSRPPGPGMCWARPRDAFPDDISPTERRRRKGGGGGQNRKRRVDETLHPQGTELLNMWACVGETYRAPLCPVTGLLPQRGLWRTLCWEPLVFLLVWKVPPASPETSARYYEMFSMHYNLQFLCFMQIHIHLQWSVYWPAGFHRCPDCRWSSEPRWGSRGTWPGPGLWNKTSWLSACPSKAGSLHPWAVSSPANWTRDTGIKMMNGWTLSFFVNKTFPILLKRMNQSTETQCSCTL